MLTKKSAPKGAFFFMKKQFDIAPTLWYYKTIKIQETKYVGVFE
jgi:hypothetical protein